MTHSDKPSDQSPDPNSDESREPETSESPSTEGESSTSPSADSSPSETAEEKPSTQKRNKVEKDRDEADEDDEETQLGGRMSFLEHLDELRKRIMYSVLAILVAFVVAWVFRESIYGFLEVPIRDVVDRLVVIKVTEPFTIYLKVSFVASVFLAAPVILLQVWLFIAPGLYRREKGYALPFLFSSTILFLLGGLFAYYVVLPPALNFLLLEFGANFQPMISAVEYFNFEMLIIIGMGVIFQLPVLVAFLSIFGMVTPRFLWKNFRYAFLLITVIAAVVSPTTDPMNLFLWSGPMVILYTISIGVSWVFQKRRARRDKRD